MREEERTQRSAARTAARTATRTVAQEQRALRQQKYETEKATYLAQRASDKKGAIQREYDEFVRGQPYLSEKDRKQYWKTLNTMYDAETRNHITQMALTYGGRRKRY
jgi:hypothetical protein